MTLLEGNLLEPLSFTDWGEIGKFIRDNRCAMCKGKFLPKHGPNRTWIAFCPGCKEDVYQHSYARKATIERVVDSELTGAVEMRQGEKPKRTEEELLNSLGF